MHGTRGAAPARIERSPRDLAVKRMVDVVVAGAALTASLPVQVAAALATLIEDGRPVFLLQARTGQAGRPFRVTKIRSMRANDLAPGAMGEISLDSPMLTGVGRVLRRLKIDELPQLLNVLKGEMSLVGPRPTLPEQTDRYDDFERRRLLVRPGLTGWAQVNGGIELTWSDRILLDVWYVDHWSLGLDARILLRTVAVVLRGERANRIAVQQAAEHARRTRREPSS